MILKWIILSNKGGRESRSGVIQRYHIIELRTSRNLMAILDMSAINDEEREQHSLNLGLKWTGLERAEGGALPGTLGWSGLSGESTTFTTSGS